MGSGERTAHHNVNNALGRPTNDTRVPLFGVTERKG